MRSPRKLLIEEIRALAGQDGSRNIDMAVQLRVWRAGPDGRPRPGELLPRVYGGRYDTFFRRYVEPTPADLNITEISAHPGQLPLLLFDEPGVMDCLALGAPRGGKTYAIIRRALLSSLIWPNCTGGLVAPTSDRRSILWNETIALLSPLGWIESLSSARHEIRLRNGACWQFVAAKLASKAIGSPIQGRTWDWAVCDERQNVEAESFREVLLRGAHRGRDYHVFSSATNQSIPAFQVELERYRTHAGKKLLTFRGIDNPYIPVETWAQQRETMSERDYRQIIEAQILPPEGQIYHAFDYSQNLRPVPAIGDSTAETTFDKLDQRGYRLIVGQDFGTRVNASIVLKSFGSGKDRVWFAVDEFISEDSTSREHAARLTSYLQKHYNAQPSDVLVIGDPHGDKLEVDKSDYTQFRQAGFKTVKASVDGKRIELKHRFSMTNALLCDTNGTRRLFIATDAHGRPKCEKLVESFRNYRFTENGKPEQFGKDARDLSHPTDGLGYALYRYERIRGAFAVKPAEEEPSLYVPASLTHGPASTRYRPRLGGR